MLNYYEYYLVEVKPLILPLYKNHGEVHSIYHIDEVVKFALDILLNSFSKKDIESNWISVILAAALHDCARNKENDAWCEKHEIQAIPKILAFFELYKEYFNLNELQCCDIIKAVSTHTSELKNLNNHIVSQCLHDADRVRLSQWYGYNENFFNTEFGKKLSINYKNNKDLSNEENK